MEPLSLAIPLWQIHSVSHVSMETREFSGALLLRSPPSAPSVITANATPARHGSRPRLAHVGALVLFWGWRKPTGFLSRARVFGETAVQNPAAGSALLFCTAKPSRLRRPLSSSGCNWFKLNHLLREMSFIFDVFDSYHTLVLSLFEAGFTCSGPSRPCSSAQMWLVNMAELVERLVFN